MTTEQQKTSTIAPVENKKPEFILTNSGVMFLGPELLGNKLAALMCEAIALDEVHGLATLVIRTDGFPIDTDETPLFGAAYADTYSVAINLQKCWDSACQTTMEGEIHLSLLGVLWINVLSALGHELDHLAVSTLDRELYEVMRSTDDGNKELEDAASISAEQMIVNLSRRFDVEIPGAGEMGWFGVKLMELFTDEDTKDLQWVIEARKDMEAGIIYNEGDDKKCFSFRDFVKKAHDPDSKTGDWEQPTTAVNLEAHLDSGVEEFKAEPVDEPVARTIDLEESEIIEVLLEADMEEQGIKTEPKEQVPVIPMVQTGNGQFVGAGVEVAERDIEFTNPVEATAAGTIASETMGAIPGVVPANAAGAAVMAEQAPLEVPLPPTVAAEQQAFATAATTGTPPIKETPTTYTPNALAPEVMAKTIKEIWQVLYHHIFTKCGWQQNPQTGRFMFTNAAAVLEGVNIQHIIQQNGADNFIMEYDTMNAEGQFAPEMCQGMVRGRTTAVAGLPSYSLYLNIGGQRFKRTFMPQNPEKRNTSNAYTNSANEAAGGHMIVWVFKDEAADNAPFKEKVAVTIKDNVYEVM